MATLAFLGGVPPSDYSEEIRRRGMTYAQAVRLQQKLIELQKQRIEFEMTLAKIRAGVPIR